jgi:hypothetical protein
MRTFLSATRGAAASRTGARARNHHRENPLLEPGPAARVAPREAGAAVRQADPTRTAGAAKTLCAL